MSAEIQLTRGFVAVVDDEDVELVSRYAWHADEKSGVVYARTRIGGRSTYLHRLLLSAPRDMVVDHIDCNGLNNRRQNLRLTNQSGNLQNSRLRKNNTSGVKGVAWHRQRGKWHANCRVEGRNISLGLHDTLASASDAVRAFRMQRFGVFANHGDERVEPPVPTSEVRRLSTRNQSGFRGVSYSSREGKWRAECCRRGLRRHLGYFPTKIAAAIEVNIAVMRAGGASEFFNPVFSGEVK